MCWFLSFFLPFKDVHHGIAEDTRHPVHLVCGIVREDEASGLIVANAALVLHLDVVRVDLGPGQHIEGAVVVSSQEDAAPTVMSEIEEFYLTDLISYIGFLKIGDKFP